MYSAKTILKKPFEAELNSYNRLQKVFRKIELLIHHDSTRITYINVDAFKRRDFEIVIYHLKPDADANNLKREEIQSIMFLSRMLTFAEKRY